MSARTRARDLFKQLTAAAGGETSGFGYPSPDPRVLDERTRALVAIGAALCSDYSTRSLKPLVKTALRAGSTEEEIIGVLFALAPAVGESRLVAVTPRISKALGYDIGEAFERG